jgi:hypothetical protein
MHSRQSLLLVLCCLMAVSFSSTSSFAYQDTSDVPEKPLDKNSKPKDNDSDAKDDKKPAPRPTVRKTYTRAELLARTRMLASSRMPNMWGDFFDGTPYPLNIIDRTVFPPEWSVNGEGGSGATLTTGPGGGGGGGSSALPPPPPRIPRAGGLASRRVKLAENNSPLPTDRWILNHNYFNDVDGIGDVNRYTFGFEKTFAEGLKSFEVRFSFANTLSNAQIFNGALNTVSGIRSDEAGNLVLNYKSVIWGLDDGVITAGMGVALPTADDQFLFNTSGQLLMKFHNDAAHLLPFIAFVRMPTDKLFIQGYAQADFASSANPALALIENGSPELSPIAKIKDVPLLFLDIAFAYKWIEDREGWINAVTPLLELHYSMGMSRRDRLQFHPPSPFNGAFDLGPPDRISVLNLTAGASLQMGDSIFVRPAVSIPLTNGAGASYDYEFGVHVNILR